MATVWLAFSDEKKQQELRRALSGHDVLVASEHVMAPDYIEVIVTDHPWSSTTDEKAPHLRRRGDTCGVVAWGWSGTADVSLPADATPREAALASILLAQIVQLRRQQQEDLRARRELRDLAYTDPLTGIPNRRAWDEELKRRTARARRSQEVLCLVLLDLDHFKRVNDQYGHAAGDEVLKEAARAIGASVRATDFVSRVGGDEFGVLLADMQAVAVSSIVERVRRAVATGCSKRAGPSVTVSIGFTRVMETDSEATFFERADTALRRAKDAGRNRTEEA